MSISNNTSTNNTTAPTTNTTTTTTSATTSLHQRRRSQQLLVTHTINGGRQRKTSNPIAAAALAQLTKEAAHATLAASNNNRELSTIQSTVRLIESIDNNNNIDRPSPKLAIIPRSNSLSSGLNRSELINSRNSNPSGGSSDSNTPTPSSSNYRYKYTNSPSTSSQNTLYFQPPPANINNQSIAVNELADESELVAAFANLPQYPYHRKYTPSPRGNNSPLLKSASAANHRSPLSASHSFTSGSINNNNNVSISPLFQSNLIPTQSLDDSDRPLNPLFHILQCRTTAANTHNNNRRSTLGLDPINSATMDSAILNAAVANNRVAVQSGAVPAYRINKKYDSSTVPAELNLSIIEYNNNINNSNNTNNNNTPTLGQSKQSGSPVRLQPSPSAGSTSGAAGLRSPPRLLYRLQQNMSNLSLSNYNSNENEDPTVSAAAPTTHSPSPSGTLRKTPSPGSTVSANTMQAHLQSQNPSQSNLLPPNQTNLLSIAAQSDRDRRRSQSSAEPVRAIHHIVAAAAASAARARFDPTTIQSSTLIKPSAVQAKKRNKSSYDKVAAAAAAKLIQQHQQHQHQQLQQQSQQQQSQLDEDYLHHSIRAFHPLNSSNNSGTESEGIH